MISFDKLRAQYIQIQSCFLRSRQAFSPWILQFAAGAGMMKDTLQATKIFLARRNLV
jgi:hypothetical protein